MPRDNDGMHIYTAYGLCLASEIPLPGLPIATGSPDVVIRLASAVDPETAGIRDKAPSPAGYRVLGTLDGVGQFWIEDGCSISVKPAAGVGADQLAPSILGTAMAVILLQRGFLVLHASSVVIGQTAIAFMGGPGWGKSTLAAAFHAQGYSVMTDDVTAIEVTPQTARVIPGFPQFKLWATSARSLGYDPAHLPPLFTGSSKLACSFEAGFQPTPLPLQHIYLLGRGDHHEIQPVPPQTAFVELVRHTRSNALLADITLSASHLQQCSQLLQQVSLRRFVRRPDLADLPQLVGLIEADLAMATAPSRS